MISTGVPKRAIGTAATCLLLLGAPLAAQQGAIAGRVTNATTLQPVPLATISVVGGGPTIQVRSENDGSYELRLGAGVYDLLVEAGDFAPTRFDRVAVSAGQTTARNLTLESQGYRLAGFIVTASRGSVDTEITAPSSSHSVSATEITDRPAPSPAEHLRDFAAVDIMTQGLQATNLVVRGFNNIFSGALHLLEDDRVIGLPALRVNLMHFLPSNDDDIERTEVVFGPGAALYGPNTANGVLQVITKSPLESQGTTVTLGAGERSVFEGSFRSAFLVDENFGVKISGHAFRGDEWAHVDSTELTALQAAEANLDGCIQGGELRGLSPEEAEIACGRVGRRNPRLSRYGFEARADWRYSPRGTFVATYGRSGSTGVELTGLGAVQTDNWVYQFIQGRFRYDRWFVQGYFMANDPGEGFMLRDGRGLNDRSTLGVVQVQNGFSLADERLDFTYGWDYFVTSPDSRGTIYGDYEENDEITEWGIYLQSKIAISSKLDLIAAGRVDAHSILPEKVLSPRLTLLFKPNDDHAIRFAYNRAFSTPTALNYFLDIGAGLFPDPELAALRYSFRAFGSGSQGFSWQNPDGTLRGMRSPFNPAGAGQLLPVDQATLWQLGVGYVADVEPISPDVLAVLQRLAPGAGDVDILYHDVITGDQGPVSGLVLPDVPPIKEDNTETFEVGWSGVWGNKVRVSADLYYMRRHDFVSPLVIETPLLLLDGAGIATWLGPAYVSERTQDLVDRLGLSVADATAQATAEASTLVPELAQGVGRLPLAVVTSDAPEMENGGADLIATYRNLGSLSLWGSDVTLKWSVTPTWTLSGTYSHVSKNWFDIDGREPLALNAPRDKATLGLAFRDEGWGLHASARVRYTGPFPALSTEFYGSECVYRPVGRRFVEDCVDDYALVDMALGYRVPNTPATVQLSVSNVLNTGYRSFAGVPNVGRLAMARVRYDLF